MVGKIVLNEKHLNGPYSPWVRRSNRGPSYAFCILCNSHFTIETMGNSGLTSHQKGDKHKRFADAAAGTPPVRGIASVTSTTLWQVSNNVTAPGVVQSVTNDGANGSSSSLSTVTVSDASDNRTQNTMLPFIVNQKLRSETLRAELLWVINTVAKNNSFTSNNDCGVLFKRMFPDSKIANGLTLGETKTKYLLEHGIMPHYLKLLQNKINQNSTSPWFVVCFDETLNVHLQEKQLDMHIRYWDGETVLSRYIQSQFLGKARAIELKECFGNLDAIQTLKFMLQISMDGPNVNLAAHKQIEEETRTKYDHGLLYMGTCAIHQVHNALKSAMEPSKEGDEFNIKQVLLALYKLFHETPARRAEYTDVTGSSLFPQSFAPHRWGENKRASSRAVEMLPHLTKFCKEHEARSRKITKITSNSYKVVKQFVLKDKFAEAKLEFFISLCDKIEPFLIAFQTDRPMAPFLITDLNDIVLSVARRFMKADYCTENKEKPMEKLVVTDSTQYRKRVDLGYSANTIVKDLLKKEYVTLTDVATLYDACRDACIRFIAKLKLKSPSQYRLPLNIDCLDPKLIANDPGTAVVHFKKALDCLVEAKLLDPRKFDIVKAQFQNFVDVHTKHIEFCDFNFRLKHHRVDTLFHKTMCGKHEFNLVWDVTKMLLVISHGQASVERGFSINKYASTVNQSEENLIARRVVRDHVNYVGGIENLEIADDMVQYCTGAYSRYQNNLANKRKDKTQQEKQSKKDVLLKQIEEKKLEVDVCKKMRLQWSDLMDKQFKLVGDSEKTKVIDSRVALKAVAEYNNNVKLEAAKLITLNEQLAALNVKFKNI